MHNLAERLSFSSYSRSIDDYWAADCDRPYQIVLMPGYSVPSGLDRLNKDARWLDGPLETPTIAWDGYCPYALFEIIYECFDYAGPGGRSKDERRATGRHVVVRDVSANRIVEDDREPVRMSFRPKRASGWGLNRTRNHMADLYAWSMIFRDLDNDASATETMNIYEDVLCSPASPKSKDSYSRMAQMQKSRLTSSDLLMNPPSSVLGYGSVCQVGPKPGLSEDSDDDEARFDTSWSGRRKMRHLLLKDLTDLNRAPESLYRYSIALGVGDLARRQHEIASGPKEDLIAADVSSDGLLDRIMNSNGGDIPL